MPLGPVPAARNAIVCTVTAHRWQRTSVISANAVPYGW
ncbi:hypothetical protein Mal4_55240 [Maioricimonas rarisocia]|uniref:Uncharacterized protein n=1 Tax=Maioricimonas rarisocia TaxID=2528026 RepID=A0A517ZFE7_9PLAN|nr:hypothetical protein Mal4_55240 [Maioricimonas rarisocia]